MCLRRIQVLRTVDTMSLYDLVNFLKRTVRVYYFLVVFTAVQLGYGIYKDNLEDIVFHSILLVLSLLYLLCFRSLCAKFPPDIRTITFVLAVIMGLSVYVVVYTVYSLIYHADWNSLFHIISLAVYMSTVYLLGKLRTKIVEENNVQAPLLSPTECYGHVRPVTYVANDIEGHAKAPSDTNVISRSIGSDV